MSRVISKFIELCCVLGGLLILSFEVEAQATLSWNADLIRVTDGDTIEVRVDGNSSIQRVRIVGFQAMEINSLSAEDPASCHSSEATDALVAMLQSVSRVRLAAANESSRSQGRLLRHLYATINGVEKNIGVELIKTGHGFALLFPAEGSFDDLYIEAQLETQKTRANFWNTSYCDVGPSQEARFKIWLNADADGDDQSNVNGEWIKVKNIGSNPVNLHNWTIRDRFLNFFYFPAGAILNPGSIFTVFVGTGVNTSSEFYLGLTAPIFGNDTWNSAYLMEPLNGSLTFRGSGDMRSFFTTPNFGDCKDPNEGKFDIFVNFDAPGNDLTADPNGEWVRVTNTSNKDIDMEDYVLRTPTSGYSFPEGYRVLANSEVTVFVGKGVDTQTSLYWGRDSVAFPNGGSEVVLETYDEVLLASFAWPINAPLDRPARRSCVSIVPITSVILED